MLCILHTIKLFRTCFLLLRLLSSDNNLFAQLVSLNLRKSIVVVCQFDKYEGFGHGQYKDWRYDYD